MRWWPLYFLISFSLFAQTEHTTGTVMVGNQLFSSWLPFRWTASYTHILNPQWSIEAEWARKKYGVGAFGIDAASVTENVYSLVARRYVTNSLHWIFGGYKEDFHAELGSDFVADETAVSDVRVQAMGVALGIGNRWRWKKGFTCGIDWFRINIPLFNKKVDNEALDNINDANDLSSVKNSIEKVKNVPTFVLFGINLGYTF